MKEAQWREGGWNLGNGYGRQLEIQVKFMISSKFKLSLRSNFNQRCKFDMLRALLECGAGRR